MNEITAADSETVIEAAARGNTVPSHEALCEALGMLHAPPTAVTGVAPTVAPAIGTTGRVVRRTALAATAAVISLTGVAAAATVGSDLLGPDEPVVEGVEDLPADLADDPVVEVEVEADGEDGGNAAVEADEAVGRDAGEPDAGDTDDGRGPARPEEITDGVEATGGFDVDELADMCEAADDHGNHGSYVSAIARNRDATAETPHGEQVRGAAHTDCGRNDHDEDGDAAEESEADESEADESEADELEADEPEADEPDEDADDGDDADDAAEDGDDERIPEGNANGHARNGEDTRPGNGQGNANGNSGDNGNAHGLDRD